MVQKEVLISRPFVSVSKSLFGTLQGEDVFGQCLEILGSSIMFDLNDEKNSYFISYFHKTEKFFFVFQN